MNLVDRVLEVYREPQRDPDAPFGWRYQSVSVYGPDASVSPLALPHARIRVSDAIL